MGTFTHPIEIGDLEGRGFERVEALVDTGASYTVAPASLLRRLGVTPQEKIKLRLADRRTVDWGIGEARVRVDGRSVATLVVFGDEEVPVLLGAYTLEGARLAVDPTGRRLLPQDVFYLMSAVETARPGLNLGPFFVKVAASEG